MEEESVYTYLSSHENYFPSELIPTLRDHLLRDETIRVSDLVDLKLMDPNSTFIASFFGGWFGVDRFMLGDVGSGVAKLLTGGGFGVWWLADLFTASNKAKQYNYTLLMRL